MALQQTRLNHQRIQLLPAPWRAVAEGKRLLEDLDDEEVFTGRLRGPKGHLGPRPQFYPQNFIDEQVRRSLSWAEEKIRDGARIAIDTLMEIMKNPQASDADRMKAAMFFTERFLGKEVQRVLVSAEDPVETLFRQILADPAGLAGGPPPRELSAEERALLS